MSTDSSSGALSEAGRAALRALPAIEKLLAHPNLVSWIDRAGRDRVVDAARSVLDHWRVQVLAGRASAVPEASPLAQEVAARVGELLDGGLRPVINATGTLLHTNLGRARMPTVVAEAAQWAAASFVDLEIDLDTGKRGNRYKGLQRLLRALTGAEDSLAVNNNAAAVLVAINTLAKKREVIVSRGELVEIGGAFRVPDIVRAAGARLVEVGTTNRTRPQDYERAITPRTGLLLKTHTSNFRIVGFQRSPTTAELVDVGRRHGIPVFEDLGSGSLLDLTRFGLTKEPTVTEVLASGVDLVSFSTDKLLGGPQGGVLVGRTAILKSIRANQMLRALRIDKVTMAMLEATLRLYLHPETVIREIPFYWAIGRSAGEVKAEAEALASQVPAGPLSVAVVSTESRIGGGACPTDRLPTFALALKHESLTASHLAARLRTGRPSVLGRIHDDAVLLDVRTIYPDDRPGVVQAIAALSERK